MKDYDKEIETLEARRRVVGIKLITKKGKYRRKLVSQAFQLDRKIGQLKIERRREKERLEREASERLEREASERQNELSARVKPAEISKVQLSRRYRMVRVYGATANRIRPHLDQMEHYRDEFKILLIQRSSRTGENRFEAHSYTLTFGDDEGLEKYLEFTGWQDLPDES